MQPLTEYVLDASALLALIDGEPGAGKVRPLMVDCIISAVNFCETVHRLRRRGLPVETVRATLTPLVPVPVPFAMSRWRMWQPRSMSEREGRGFPWATAPAWPWLCHEACLRSPRKRSGKNATWESRFSGFARRPGRIVQNSVEEKVQFSVKDGRRSKNRNGAREGTNRQSATLGPLAMRFIAGLLRTERAFRA